MFARIAEHTNQLTLTGNNEATEIGVRREYSLPSN